MSAWSPAMKHRRKVREKMISSLRHLKAEIEVYQRHSHRLRRHRSVAPFEFVQWDEDRIKQLLRDRREERALIFDLLTRPSRAPGRIVSGAFYLKGLFRSLNPH
jgi:hypothetical protein